MLNLGEAVAAAAEGMARSIDHVEAINSALY